MHQFCTCKVKSVSTRGWLDYIKAIPRQGGPLPLTLWSFKISVFDHKKYLNLKNILVYIIFWVTWSALKRGCSNNNMAYKWFERSSWCALGAAKGKTFRSWRQAYLTKQCGPLAVSRELLRRICGAIVEEDSSPTLSGAQSRVWFVRKAAKTVGRL